MVDMKKCNKCTEVKSLSDFNKNKNKSDGYHHWCRICVSNNNKKLYKNNTDDIRTKSSKYYYENKETISLKSKSKPSYSVLNPNYYKEYRIKKGEEYRNYINEYNKKRRNEDDSYRTIRNIRSQVYAYLKTNKGDNKTEELLGYTYDTFINIIGLIPKGYQLDHKIPVSWFKDNTPVNIIWHLDNLHIVTKEYNKQKLNLYSDKIPTEYRSIVMEWVQDNRIDQIS